MIDNFNQTKLKIMANVNNNLTCKLSFFFQNIKQQSHKLKNNSFAQFDHANADYIDMPF